MIVALDLLVRTTAFVVIAVAVLAPAWSRAQRDRLSRLSLGLAVCMPLAIIAIGSIGAPGSVLLPLFRQIEAAADPWKDRLAGHLAAWDMDLGAGQLILLGYAVICMALVARRILDHSVTHIALRNARQADPAWMAELARQVAQAPLRQPVDVRVTTRVRSPLVTGLGRGTIYVDPGTHGAPTLAPAVLAHELAHIRRGDIRARLLRQLVAVLIWPVLPACRLERDVARSVEEAADAASVRMVGPAPYADSLLRIARARARPGPAGLPMAASDLTMRVRAILQPHPPLPPPVHGGALLLILAAWLAGVALGGPARDFPTQPTNPGAPWADLSPLKVSK